MKKLEKKFWLCHYLQVKLEQIEEIDISHGYGIHDFGICGITKKEEYFLKGVEILRRIAPEHAKYYSELYIDLVNNKLK